MPPIDGKPSPRGDRDLALAVDLSPCSIDCLPLFSSWRTELQVLSRQSLPLHHFLEAKQDQKKEAAFIATRVFGARIPSSLTFFALRPTLHLIQPLIVLYPTVLWAHALVSLVLSGGSTPNILLISPWRAGNCCIACDDFPNPLAISPPRPCVRFLVLQQFVLQILELLLRLSHVRATSPSVSAQFAPTLAATFLFGFP